MSIKTSITDEALLEKLENSELDFDQIMDISPLIPHMNDQEKLDLLHFIQESNQLAVEEQKFQQEYQEGLENLNKEYEQKSVQLIRKNTSEARQAFENLDQPSEGDIEADLDEQMNSIKF